MPSQSYQERPEWAEYVDSVVESAPVLSDAQKERLEFLLQPNVAQKVSKKESAA